MAAGKGEGGCESEEVFERAHSGIRVSGGFARLAGVDGRSVTEVGQGTPGRTTRLCSKIKFPANDRLVRFELDSGTYSFSLLAFWARVAGTSAEFDRFALL